MCPSRERPASLGAACSCVQLRAAQSGGDSSRCRRGERRTAGCLPVRRRALEALAALSSAERVWPQQGVAAGGSPCRSWLQPLSPPHSARPGGVSRYLCAGPARPAPTQGSNSMASSLAGCRRRPPTSQPPTATAAGSAAATRRQRQRRQAVLDQGAATPVGPPFAGRAPIGASRPPTWRPAAPAKREQRNRLRTA